MVLNGRKCLSLLSEFVSPIMSRKIAYSLGRSNIDINGTTNCNDSLFRFSAISQLSYAPNDFHFVCSLPRGIVIPSENPHVWAALALQFEETSLLKSVHTISYGFDEQLILHSIWHVCAFARCGWFDLTRDLLGRYAGLSH